MNGSLTVERLDEASLAAEIPCEVRLVTDPDKRCGDPSVARIRVRCACGERMRFICARHLDALGRDRMACYHCNAGFDSWSIC
jgi:hypothetical protein